MKHTLSLAITAATLAASSLGVAQADSFPGYAETGKGTIWKNAYGECWHVNSTYKKDLAVNGCDLSDADNDGVADGKDACPTTPKGVKVDVLGCNPDSDNDGIRDYKDACPNSAPGVEVDAKGCEIPKKPEPKKPEPVAKIDMTVGPVYFAFDSAKLDDIARAVLDANAAALADSKVTSVVVTGYTDATGSDSYNKKLSQQRAESVRGYLVDHGVAADKIALDSEGEADPAAPNNTSAGRAKNRRVIVNGHN